jgi:nicotinamide-nucleotide amidase
MPVEAVPVAIVSIGDELLIGQTINTNAAWLGEQVDLDSCRVIKVISIGDKLPDILAALEDAGGKAGIVIVSGGLGPTADDITKPAICQFFDTFMSLHEATLTRVESLFARRGMSLTDRNRAQAMVPHSAQILPNEKGTAPGLWLQREGVHYFFLPGVPFEMQSLYLNEIRPLLNKMYPGKRSFHTHYLVHGVGESMLADRLRGFEASLPPNISLAYLPSPGLVRLRLSMRQFSNAKDELGFEDFALKLKALCAEDLVGEGTDNLEQVVGVLLREAGMSVAVAESCTGGMVSQLLTSVAGASDYFLGSVVAYHNSAKIKLLGVDPAVIATHGAVSREVAGQMAEGIRELYGSDYGLASTGIAGPGGGSAEKPVGTVFLAFASAKGLQVTQFRFGDERWRNIRCSAQMLLDMLRRDLMRFK